jgi:hypothetical protein
MNMNHTEYQKSLKSKSYASLQYIAKDAYEAMLAMPHGSKAGYYADEVNYATMEMAARNAKDSK